VGAIVWWLTEGRSWSPEQVAAWLNQLSKANIELAVGEAVGDTARQGPR